MNEKYAIALVPVSRLIHIEGFSRSRVDWLVDKIQKEGRWTKPLALDDAHNLVLDGQHRMEAAKILQLTHVPTIKFKYAEVELWSLRPKYEFDWISVVERALAGDIYPYKTVKHRFPIDLPSIDLSIADLKA